LQARWDWHGVEPQDLETGSSLRSHRHPFRASCRPSLRLPRERFSPHVDSGRPERAISEHSGSVREQYNDPKRKFLLSVVRPLWRLKRKFSPHRRIGGWRSKRSSSRRSLRFKASASSASAQRRLKSLRRVGSSIPQREGGFRAELSNRLWTSVRFDGGERLLQ
jgi:hypothetical protein